jgi:hypothetical protein
MLHPCVWRLGELSAHDVKDWSWGQNGDFVDIATDSFVT